MHALVIALLWLSPLAPFNDVTVVYRQWVLDGLELGRWVGITTEFVYPPLALAPMLAAALGGLDALAYGWAWLVLVTVLDAAAVAVLTRRGGASARRRGLLAAWWWLAFLLLLGPVGVARLEAITAPLAIIAVRLLADRPAIAGALLAAGAWIKIWPGALLAAAVLALRTRVRVLLGAVAVSLAVLAVGLVLGGRGELLSFLGGQTGRGLQVESLLAAPWLVAVAVGSPSAAVVWNPALNTFEVTGPGSALLADWSTPLLLAGAVAIAVLGLLARRRAPRETLVLLGIALTAVLVVTNKVGSPQFTAWLAAPLVLAILLGASRGPAWGRRGTAWPAVLALAIAALTQLVYPTTYDRLLAGDATVVALLVLKHLCWLALTAWSVTGLVALARPRR